MLAVAVGATLGAGLTARLDADEGVFPVVEEDPIEPDLPIVDPHFHLYGGNPDPYGRPLYRLAHLAADIAASGHKVEAGVFMECLTNYRTSGPEELRSLGETEYVRAEAEAAAGTAYANLASAMMARLDVSMGERVADLLALHQEASGGRLRGVRNSIAWDAFPPYDQMSGDPHLFERPGFGAGMREMARAEMMLESWLFHPQIPQFTALAQACPDNLLILDHVGCPLLVGPYADRTDAVFAQWSQDMAALAKCDNVLVKVGGLGPFWQPVDEGQPTSVALASQWKPWIERTVELFGPERCMFESNYPANRSVSSYGRIWNAFKLVSQGWSDDERAALFSGTARRSFALG